MDSFDSSDSRFRSHYADYDGKERFENSQMVRSSSSNKLLSISPQNIIRNKQAMKAEFNRRLDWQMWVLKMPVQPQKSSFLFLREIVFPRILKISISYRFIALG